MATENDTKRAKQQFAQRSRVRKLQYISELERNVQAIQAEGSEVSAELDFLNQQNLILSMENKALKQRLESLAQEQLIKHCKSLDNTVNLSQWSMKCWRERLPATSIIPATAATTTATPTKQQAAESAASFLHPQKDQQQRPRFPVCKPQLEAQRR